MTFHCDWVVIDYIVTRPNWPRKFLAAMWKYVCLHKRVLFRFTKINLIIEARWESRQSMKIARRLSRHEFLIARYNFIILPPRPLGSIYMVLYIWERIWDMYKKATAHFKERRGGEPLPFSGFLPFSRAQPLP